MSSALRSEIQRSVDFGRSSPSSPDPFIDNNRNHHLSSAPVSSAPSPVELQALRRSRRPEQPGALFFSAVFKSAFSLPLLYVFVGASFFAPNRFAGIVAYTATRTENRTSGSLRCVPIAQARFFVNHGVALHQLERGVFPRVCRRFRFVILDEISLSRTPNDRQSPAAKAPSRRSPSQDWQEEFGAVRHFSTLPRVRRPTT